MRMVSCQVEAHDRPHHREDAARVEVFHRRLVPAQDENGYIDGRESREQEQRRRSAQQRPLPGTSETNVMRPTAMVVNRIAACGVRREGCTFGIPARMFLRPPAGVRRHLTNSTERHSK
ncbi:hypothetical protein [Nonomuraea basaltis]|uniref:hypothetical protein n=1 Tax=Nonomuraea basaltis TaxID=2495887 RepID=UPI001485E1AB|nr:hypothetical protein [Nonomuraea basaltis]